MDRRAFVLPWHRDNCPGLVAGLQGLGYEEYEQKLHPVSTSRAEAFGAWWQAQKDPVRRAEQLRKQHRALLDGLLQMLEDQWAREGPAMFPRLNKALTRHLRDINAIKDLSAISLKKEGTQQLGALR